MGEERGIAHSRGEDIYMKIGEVREIEGDMVEVNTQGHITYGFMSVILKYLLDNMGYVVDKDAIINNRSDYGRWFNVTYPNPDSATIQRMFTFKLKK